MNDNFQISCIFLRNTYLVIYASVRSCSIMSLWCRAGTPYSIFIIREREWQPKLRNNYILSSTIWRKILIKLVSWRASRRIKAYSAIRRCIIRQDARAAMKYQEAQARYLEVIFQKIFRCTPSSFLCAYA